MRMILIPLQLSPKRRGIKDTRSWASETFTLGSGRFLLGNKYARTFAFFYTIGLHILVFTCLYRVSALSYLSHGSEEPLVVEKNLNLPRRH
ncbi:protein CASP-like isoform X2 [Hibiscus syriacus]|uniref:protein CASP-like isoform X2 n=1 Tax=Hibiscus syriacus TaxID=106335 RepID=UPI001924B5E1|nr:protein CASP-like isoform X2 [Hibiscus syriacus]